MSIGNRIRELRGKDSRKVFSAYFGISEMTLVRYEKNERVPDASLIALICQKYNITSDWLIFGNKPRPTRPVEWLGPEQNVLNPSANMPIYVELKQRLDRLLTVTKSRNIKDLSIVLNIPYEEIARELKHNNVPIAWCEIASEKLNISFEWIAVGTVPKRQDDNNRSEESDPANKYLADKEENSQEDSDVNQDESVITQDISVAPKQPDQNQSSLFSLLTTIAPDRFDYIWSRFCNTSTSFKGWTQIELLNRFPEFIQWVERNQDDIKGILNGTSELYPSMPSGIFTSYLDDSFVFSSLNS